MRSVGILKTNKVDNYHGISIFLPDDARWYNGIAPWDSTHTHKIKEYYVSLDFSETQWDEFLNALYVG